MFKRKIFYLGGFDPRGARFYHQMFRDEAHKFNGMAGRSVVVGRRQKRPHESTSWQIEDEAAGAVTDYEFLGWDDLVRDNWIKSPARLLLSALRSYWNFVTRLDWKIVKRFPIGVRLAFFAPGMFGIVLPVILAMLLWLGAALLFGAAIGAAVALVIAATTTIIVMQRIRGLWLLRFIIFNDVLARGRLSPALHARMDHFAEAIRASLDEDWDEILFVTHSNGSILAVPVMARLLDACGGSLPAKFTLVTLGSCIALIGNRKDSTHFHALLETMGQGDFHWLDIGSITDIICIANIDPCVSCRQPRRATLQQLSPRWFRYADPATYAARKADRHQTHFDYLRTSHRLSPLDYIAMSSGARPIRDSIAAFRLDIDTPAVSN